MSGFWICYSMKPLQHMVQKLATPFFSRSKPTFTRLLMGSKITQDVSTFPIFRAIFKYVPLMAQFEPMYHWILQLLRIKMMYNFFGKHRVHRLKKYRLNSPYYT